jgi:hypothetical protein
MPRSVRILSPLVVLSLAAIVGCGGKQSKNAEKTADRLRQEISAEIASLKDHPWAGKYYEGDGLGVNVSLAIAPKSGYVFEWHGCMGLYDRNYGTAQWKDGEIQLSFTFKNERKGFQGIAEKLIPVAWGPRKYLIPADSVIEFCNEVNEGREPRRGMHGMCLLRDGDEKKKVDGLPDVPKEYQPYLLKERIRAAIVAVGKSVVDSGGGLDERTTAVTVNVGKKGGILSGMVLYVIEPSTGVDSVKITKVEDDKSEGVLSQIGKDEPVPSVGWKLSTRAPWHP